MAIVSVAALSAAARGDYASDGARIAQVQAQVDQLVRQVEALRADAAGKGEAIRASCIEEKLKALRNYARAIDIIHDSWPSAAHNPAFAQRSLQRVDAIVAGSNGYAADARACNEGRESDVRFTVKVEVSTEPPPGNLGGGPLPLGPFERPVLASPY